MSSKQALTLSLWSFPRTLHSQAQVLVGQPFDLVKVLTQTSAHGTYTGPLDCFSKVLKSEGPLAFYKGTLTPLLGIGACVSIQFAALGAAKRFFEDRKPKLSSGGFSSSATGKPELNTTELFLSGAFAGTANTILSGPIENIRIKLQGQDMKNKLYDGPLDCAKKLYAREGLKGVFKGQVPTILRDGIGYGWVLDTFYAQGVMIFFMLLTIRLMLCYFQFLLCSLRFNNPTNLSFPLYPPRSNFPTLRRFIRMYRRLRFMVLHLSYRCIEK